MRTSLARMAFLNAHASIGPLIESLWDIPLTGGERAEPFLAPGLKLQLGGWHFGASYLFPFRSRSEAPSELALTAGYHVSFSRRRLPSVQEDSSLPACVPGAP